MGDGAIAVEFIWEVSREAQVVRLHHSDMGIPID